MARLVVRLMIQASLRREGSRSQDLIRAASMKSLPRPVTPLSGAAAGFVEQRLGSLARTDRFQVSECIHDELHGAGLIHERLAAMVGQDDSDGVEQLRRRAGRRP